MEAREFTCKDQGQYVVEEMKKNIFQKPGMTLDNMTLPTTMSQPRSRVCFCWDADEHALNTNSVANGIMEEIFGGKSYTFCGFVVMFYLSEDGKRMSQGIQTVEDLNMVVQDIKRAFQTENFAVGRAEAFAG
jgi:hypothetical protein